jgi:O-antigen/teichoic acid export membrane protein
MKTVAPRTDPEPFALSPAVNLPQAEAPSPIGPESPGRIRRYQQELRENHMVRNSMYSLLSTVLQAGFGFVFWILAARIFSVPQVGRATSLISAASFIGLVALFGLNSTLTRYLPTSQRRSTMMTIGVALVAVVGTVIALGYIVALPLIAPKLQFMDERIGFAVGFVLLTGAATVNKLTDYIFIAARRTGINALVDGGIGGVARLLLLPLLAGAGAFGLYSAWVGGLALISVVSVVLMWTQLNWRPGFKGAREVMLPLLRFSGVNYLANVFNLIPTLVVPLIVLDRLGAKNAAFYYMAFQIANLLYSGAYAVEENFLAEGAHGEERLTSLMWRAAKLLAMMAIPAAVLGAALSPWILLVFGKSYSSHGSSALMFMAVAAIPIAAQNWLITILRLTGQLLAITVSNAVYAVGICGVAWWLGPRGLSMVGVAWLLGSSAGVLVATVALLRGARRGELAR